MAPRGDALTEGERQYLAQILDSREFQGILDRLERNRLAELKSIPWWNARKRLKAVDRLLQVDELRATMRTAANAGKFNK